VGYKRKVYRLKLTDPWTRSKAEKLAIKNAEKYLRFREGVKGKLKPLRIDYYLEVEDWGDDKFEMPCAETCFVELDENREPIAFYRVKVYFNLEGGEFIYVSKPKKSKENICK